MKKMNFFNILSKAGQNVANFYQSFTSDLSISSFLNFAKQFYVTFIYQLFVILFFLEFFFITKEMTQGARRGGCYVQYKKYYKPSNGQLVSVSLPSLTMHRCRCAHPSPVHSAQPRSDHAPVLRPQN